MEYSLCTRKTRSGIISELILRTGRSALRPRHMVRPLSLHPFVTTNVLSTTQHAIESVILKWCMRRGWGCVKIPSIIEASFSFAFLDKCITLQSWRAEFWKLKRFRLGKTLGKGRLTTQFEGIFFSCHISLPNRVSPKCTQINRMYKLRNKRVPICIWNDVERHWRLTPPDPVRAKFHRIPKELKEADTLVVFCSVEKAFYAWAQMHLLRLPFLIDLLRHPRSFCSSVEQSEKRDNLTFAAWQPLNYSQTCRRMQVFQC